MPQPDMMDNLKNASKALVSSSKDYDPKGPTDGDDEGAAKQNNAYLQALKSFKESLVKATAETKNPKNLEAINTIVTDTVKGIKESAAAREAIVDDAKGFMKIAMKITGANKLERASAEMLRNDASSIQDSFATQKKTPTEERQMPPSSSTALLSNPVEVSRADLVAPLNTGKVAPSSGKAQGKPQ